MGTVRLQLELESVEVDMDLATPCGLLVNELVSNALKHGFADGRSGTLSLVLHPDAGTGLVVVLALLRSGHSGLSLQAADVMLLVAMACAAVGYGFGGRLSQRMRAEHVICWALVITLPINLPLAVWQFPTQVHSIAAWAAFAYVSVFSMWLGFFAWYRGLALGGTVRVSQVRLLRPFLGMLFAVPLLGERLDATTVGFGVAVIATVFVSRRMPVQPALQSART